MDHQTARERLQSERVKVVELLARSTADGLDERASANENGDMSNPAEDLVSEQVDDAIARALRERLAVISRAEQRLRDGTYGLSVRSGRPIPDERLEADPAAELTVDEARDA